MKDLLLLDLAEEDLSFEIVCLIGEGDGVGCL